MKPQQKIWALKTSLLPRLLHQALFAEPTTTLKTLDRLSRQFTRKLLHLPKDTPLGAFHASKSEGGLGISFITGIPALKKKRLTRLAEAPDNIVSQAARSEPRPTSVPPPPKYWANKIHDSVNGAGLREAHLSPPSSKWALGIN